MEENEKSKDEMFSQLLNLHDEVRHCVTRLTIFFKTLPTHQSLLQKSHFFLFIFRINQSSQFDKIAQIDIES